MTKLYGLKCDQCGKFAPSDSIGGWVRVAVLDDDATLDYAGLPPATLADGHLCSRGCAHDFLDKQLQVIR